MKCRHAHKHLVDLFDTEPDRLLLEELATHLKGCPQCAREYEDLKQAMEPLRLSHQVRASAGFKERIMNKITDNVDIASVKGREAHLRFLKPVLAGAVAALILVAVSFGVWVTQNRGQKPLSAFTVLGQAAYAVANLQSVHISARMRTAPQDNFELILLDKDFVAIDLWKRFSDPPQWRIEKPMRVVVMDGGSSVLWIKNVNMAAKGSPGAGFVEWLKPLMDVDKVLDAELRLAKGNGSDLTLTHETGPDGEPELVVQVEAKAQGDYSNDWLRNKSVQDSDNLRIYRIGADSKRLKGLQVFVHAAQGDVLVFETTNIEYDIDIDLGLFTLALPADVTWSQEPEVLSDNDKYAQMTPDQMARAFFEACAQENWDEALKFTDYSSVPQWMKDYLGGLEIVSIGTPFKSGLYPGWFVPYEIRFKNGGVKKMNLAVRNDNPAHRYVFDGGI